MSARALIVSIPLLIMLTAAAAPAQNTADADALFEKGKLEMDRKNYKAACSAFRESHKLDPVPGALHALAVCHAEAGEIASAVVSFDDYLRAVASLPPAQQAKHAQRVQSATEQKAALAPAVPELTLVLTPKAAPGTRVLHNGVELRPTSLGVSLPVDPGEHVITTLLPGRPPIEQRIRIEKGEKKRIDLDSRPTERDERPSIGRATEPSQERPFDASKETSPLAPTKSTNWSFIGGIGGLGLGAAALGVGIVGTIQGAGLRSKFDPYRGLQPYSREENICEFAEQTQNDPDLMEDSRAIVSLCRSGTTVEVLQAVMYPLFVAATAGGVYLLLTDDPAKSDAATKVEIVPRVGPTAAAVDITFRF